MSRMRWPPTKLQPSICKPCSSSSTSVPATQWRNKPETSYQPPEQAVVDTQANLNRAQRTVWQVQESLHSDAGATDQLNTIAHETQGNLERLHELQTSVGRT